MRGASWGSDLRSISDSPMRMRMFAGQSPNLRPLAMIIFSAKASAMAREAEVTAGRRTTPAMGGWAATILPMLAPILAPGRAGRLDAGGGGAGAGAEAA